MKAIPTRFMGFRFRSRLEARWAVFLSALGVRFEYEAEGYELDTTQYRLDDGDERKTIWYLPDFWIPQWDAFVEIKPAGPLDYDAEIKAGLLAANSGKPVVVFAGQPWPGEYEALLYCQYYADGMHRLVLDECSFTFTKWLVQLTGSGQVSYGFRLDTASGYEHGRTVFDPACGKSPHLIEAYEAARAASFERFGGRA